MIGSSIIENIKDEALGVMARAFGELVACSTVNNHPTLLEFVNCSEDFATSVNL